MNTYAIAQRTNESAFIRNDLPVFDTVESGYYFIACELFDPEYSMFHLTPLAEDGNCVTCDQYEDCLGC